MVCKYCRPNTEWWFQLYHWSLWHLWWQQIEWYDRQRPSRLFQYGGSSCTGQLHWKLEVSQVFDDLYERFKAETQIRVTMLKKLIKFTLIHFSFCFFLYNFFPCLDNLETFDYKNRAGWQKIFIFYSFRSREFESLCKRSNFIYPSCFLYSRNAPEVNLCI